MKELLTVIIEKCIRCLLFQLLLFFKQLYQNYSGVYLKNRIVRSKQ